MQPVIQYETVAAFWSSNPISGRNKGNLSRTLKTFQRHQLVDPIEEDRRKKPVALATQFDIRVYAVQSLGRIGGRKAIEALKKYAAYEDFHGRSGIRFFNFGENIICDKAQCS